MQNTLLVALVACMLFVIALASPPMPELSLVKAGLTEGSHIKHLTVGGEQVEVELDVVKGKIQRTSLTFTSRVAAPQTEIQFYQFTPANQLYKASANFNASSKVATFTDINLAIEELPMEFRLGVIVVERVESHFAYELDGIPEQLLDGELYDLRPANATMGFKFMSRVQNDALGVWVTRRSPIPPFILTIEGVEDEPIVMSQMSAPPDGIGLSDVIRNVTDVEKGQQIVLRAVFFENPREHTATSTIDMSEGLIKELVNTPTTFKRIETTLMGTFFQLQYYASTGYVSCKIIQPSPIKNLMLTVKSDDRAILFREEEHQIPHLAQDSSIQFGWYNVIPTELAKVKTLTIEAQFSTREELHPMELMNEWIEDNGGITNGVAQLHGGRRQRHTHSFKTIAASQDFEKGATIASIPYRLLLTNNIVEGNEWVNQFKGNSSTYRALAAEYGLGDSSIHFMYMTFFAIVQPNSHIDGTNWRLYFDTLPKEDPPLPSFYTKDELQHYSFAPVLINHTTKVDRLWKAEYDTLIDEAPWLAEHINMDRYRTVRGHMESRIFNISGTLTMIPLMDFMHHDDDPSVNLAYDDQKQEIRFEAVRKVKKGDALTINYGTSDGKTKLDFLFQFGFVPTGAADSAIVYVNGSGFQLTEGKESRNELMSKVQKDLTGDDGDLDDLSPEDKAKVVAAVKDILTSHLEELPPHLTPLRESTSKNHHHAADPQHFQSTATEVLDSMKRVLERHIKWVSVL